ncbi:carboxypeptidase regulatory-like domain-containing protein [Silvibacterium acidisoli]|uniref:carboxypeptidase regulatory-like domain-containing protein n=1 Tax=Acidobacteriaceae bacterium ZG23-2 TaxID=2883246 RepID=UPI00406CBC8D
MQRHLSCAWRAWTSLSVLAIFTVLFNLPLHAQFNGHLAGTVTDTTGAVVSGATVKLTNEGTNVGKTATTNASGYYSFNELGPGSYTVEVSASGFKGSTLNHIGLAGEAARNVDVKLEVGGSAQTVTVNGSDVPALQTSDANISGSIDNQQLQRIPAYGRDPYELLRLTPGITGDGARASNGQSVFLPNGAGPGGSNSGIFQTENQVQISANGQRIGDNNFLVDGVSVNSLSHGGAAVVTPNIEAVGNITVISSAYSAEYGRNTGAQILTTTQSGTNGFHGSSSFTYDEPGLNAYNKYGGPSEQPTVRVQNKERNWAAGVGGPIIKNKLFLFASYEGFKENNPTYESQFIETPQFRSQVAALGGVSAGIASASGEVPRVNAYLPVNCGVASATQVATVVTGNPAAYPTTQYPCNAVAGGLDFGSPFAGGTGVYVPTPPTGVTTAYSSIGGGLDNVPDVQYAQLLLPSRARGNQFNARGDWYITPKDQLAGIIYVTKLDNFQAGGATGSRADGDVPFKPLNSALTAIYIHTFGPNTINEFRANATRFTDNGVKDSAGVVNWGIPYINIQGMSFDGTNDINYGPAASSTSPAIFAENTYEVRDMVTHTIGTHTFRMGFEYRLEQDNDNLAGDARPTYAFNGMWSFASSTPDYEAIYADPSTGGTPNTARYLWDHYYGAFLQHDWKVSQNLTLNTGLRWEYFEPLYNHGFEINYPTLGPAGNELAGATLLPRNHLWNSQYNNFSPKLGFAYTPPNMGDKMVIRGGFAMAYNRLPVALFNNAIENGPGFFNYSLCCATTSPDTGAGIVQYQTGSSTSPYSYAANSSLITQVNANGLPVTSTGAFIPIEVYGAQQNLKTPYSYLYSLEVQRELPWDFVATVGYQGSTGRHYTRLVNQEFLYDNTNSPFTQGAYFAQSDSNEYYNGMNLHLSKRMRHGLQFDAVYTWSKAMDQVSNGDQADSAANQTDPADNRTELGPSDYDIRHRVTVSGVWTIPGTHGNGIVSSFTNGWQINGVWTWHTGFPFTPVTYNLHGVPSVENASVVTPVRPLGYYGGARTGCDNSLFEPGAGNAFANGGSSYFNITPPPGGAGTNPGIGRNSFRGPCYQDTDISVAKEQKIKWLGDAGMVRFQANFYNMFNNLNLTPFTFSTNATIVENAQFGQAQSASAGRVIEFLGRFRF